jgi:hypothetical protein
VVQKSGGLWEYIVEMKARPWSQWLLVVGIIEERWRNWVAMVNGVDGVLVCAVVGGGGGWCAVVQWSL